MTAAARVALIVGSSLMVVASVAGGQALPLYELEILPANVQVLDSSPCGEVYVPAAFRFAGREWEVEVRYRGAGSCGAAKRSFQVRFRREDPFSDGRRRLILKAEPYDWTLMVEKLTYDLFAQSRCPASTATFVGLELNGAFNGVYLDVERVDADMLKRTGRDPHGDLYRAGGFGHWQGQWGPDAYERREGRDDNGEALRDLLEWFNRADDEELRRELPRRMRMDSYLDYLAVLILAGRNEVEADDWFLYRDPATDLWEVITWDNNNGNFGLGLPWDPAELFAYTSPLFQTFHDVSPGNSWWRTLPSRLLDIPEHRQALGRRLTELLEQVFTTGAMLALVDDRFAAISADAARDPYIDQAELAAAPGALKTFVAERRGFLLEWVAANLLTEQPAPVVVNEIMAGGPSSWVELLNRGTETAALGGYWLTDELRHRPLLWPFPEGTVLGPGERLVVHGASSTADGLHASFDLSPGGGEVALTTTAGELLVVADVQLFGHHTAGFSLGRTPDGASSYAYLASPTPGTANPGSGESVPRIRGVARAPATPDELDPVTVTAAVEVDGAVGTAAVRRWESSTQGNPVPNPGFELGGGDDADAWLEDGFLRSIEEGAHSGEAFMWSEAGRAARLESGLFPLAAGDHRLSVSLRGDAFVTLSVRVGDGQIARGSFIYDHADWGDWTLDVGLTSPTDGATVIIEKGEGYLEVDDVSLGQQTASRVVATFVMRDDGTGGDAVAGDGTFTAQVPPSSDLVLYDLVVADTSGLEQVAPMVSPARLYRYTPLAVQTSAVVVNEILASNDTVRADEAGEYDDWFELHNTGPTAVDLSGMFLSDDAADSTEWEIPAGTVIPVGGFLLFWADGDEEQGPLHTTFRLSASGGEAVALFDTAARGNALLDLVSFGPQTTDVSIGCFPDGERPVVTLSPPTPGAANMIEPPHGGPRLPSGRLRP